MKHEHYIYTLYTLALAGTLFSGYLSGVKFFTNTCALGEGCPLFFGYPACYFGFLLFLTLFISITSALLKWAMYTKVLHVMRVVSFLGVLFSGYYVFGEVLNFAVSGFKSGALILPTCAYGFIFFLAIFTVVTKFKKIETNI